ncbi:MAG: hypothetical protein PHD43_02300 [Methylococcales bacterium]|nr:hypothetical protein [Methylococcales bacterium]
MSTRFKEDTGTPVVEDYADQTPFRFTGRLARLTIDLKDSDQPVAVDTGL